jgi:probable RNA-binding protein EIF1AD
MSGAGRKSVYRKSVTKEYLDGMPEPDAAQGDVIALVKASRGTNIFEVCNWS